VLQRHSLTPAPRVSHPFFFLIIPPPPTSTLCPYTTLFRSRRIVVGLRRTKMLTFVTGEGMQVAFFPAHCDLDNLMQLVEGGVARSEEHTSELQSRENLVCRLLLEKKISIIRNHAAS